MIAENFHGAMDALLYFTDCQLATLGHFAYRKTSPKNETMRHLRLAKKMVQSCHSFSGGSYTEERKQLERRLESAVAELRSKFGPDFDKTGGL